MTVLCWAGFNPAAHAEFIVSSAIIEFTGDGASSQDIDLVSRSKDNDYIVAEVAEILHPGQPDETRQVIDDPSQGMLLVTPDKTILAGGSRKVMRFVLLKEPDAQEHIYRVALRPVIRGVDSASSKLGLKILVGYEILVIVRPAAMAPDYTARRVGKSLKIANNGNTNILFENGQQCAAPASCKPAPVARIYPGQQAQINLPADMPVTYAIWDGQQTVTRQY